MTIKKNNHHNCVWNFFQYCAGNFFQRLYLFVPKKCASFIKNENGVSMIETAIVSPVLFMIILSLFELNMLRKSKAMVDVIATECSLSFSATGKTDNFISIFHKYLEGRNNVSSKVGYYFNIFDNLDEMIKLSHWGAGDVFYLQNAMVVNSVDVNKDSLYTKSENSEMLVNPFSVDKANSGNAFIFTVAIKYQFMSFLTADCFRFLFNAEENEPGASSGDNTSFILWSRTVGVIS